MLHKRITVVHDRVGRTVYGHRGNAVFSPGLRSVRVIYSAGDWTLTQQE